MKQYKVHWNRSDYGYIIIEAESEQHAREKFLSCEWEDNELVIKDGGMDIEDIELN